MDQQYVGIYIRLCTFFCPIAQPLDPFIAERFELTDACDDRYLARSESPRPPEPLEQVSRHSKGAEHMTKRASPLSGGCCIQIPGYLSPGAQELHGIKEWQRTAAGDPNRRGRNLAGVLQKNLRRADCQYAG